MQRSQSKHRYDRATLRMTACRRTRPLSERKNQKRNV